MSNKFHQISRDVHIYSWGYRLNTHVYSLDVNLLFSFFNSGRKKKERIKNSSRDKRRGNWDKIDKEQEYWGAIEINIFGRGMGGGVVGVTPSFSRPFSLNAINDEHS